MILLNKNNPIYTLFHVSTHFCMCGTVQSGHLKSPARTKVNIYKIIFPKNKGTFTILMADVIQYANAYFNLKNHDFWCGRLRTHQDTWHWTYSAVFFPCMLPSPHCGMFSFKSFC